MKVIERDVVKKRERGKIREELKKTRERGNEKRGKCEKKKSRKALRENRRKRKMME